LKSLNQTLYGNNVDSLRCKHSHEIDVVEHYQKRSCDHSLKNVNAGCSIEETLLAPIQSQPYAFYESQTIDQPQKKSRGQSSMSW
jgi:hypothetical protein